MTEYLTQIQLRNGDSEEEKITRCDHTLPRRNVRVVQRAVEDFLLKICYLGRVSGRFSQSMQI